MQISSTLQGHLTETVDLHCGESSNTVESRPVMGFYYLFVIYRVFQKVMDILKSLYIIQILYFSVHFLTDINKSYCLLIFRTILYVE